MAGISCSLCYIPLRSNRYKAAIGSKCSADYFVSNRVAHELLKPCLIRYVVYVRSGSSYDCPSFIFLLLSEVSLLHFRGSRAGARSPGPWGNQSSAENETNSPAIAPSPDLPASYVAYRSLRSYVAGSARSFAALWSVRAAVCKRRHFSKHGAGRVPRARILGGFVGGFLVKVERVTAPA